MIKKIKHISKIILIISFIFSIQLYVKKINLFQLKTINISGNYFVKESNIKNILKEYKNSKINNLELKKLEKSLNNHSYIKASKIYKVLPNIISVEIKEVSPVALYENNKKYYFIDEEGNNINANIDAINYFSVPIISNNSSVIKNNIVDILNIIKSKNLKFYNSLNEIKVQNETILLEIDNGTKIKINQSSDYNDIYKLLSFLKTIKNNKNITDYKYVDLTIPKQIIVKENKKI